MTIRTLEDRLGDTEKRLNRQERRLTGSGIVYGTVDVNWSSGLAPVYLGGDLTSTPLYAMVPRSGVQPGDTVVIKQLDSGDWIVLEAYTSTPKFLQKINIPTTANWARYDAVDTVIFSQFSWGDPLTKSGLCASLSVAGIVVVEGMVRATPADSRVLPAGTLIGTLPVGMRPHQKMRFPIMATNNGYGQLAVATDGSITIDGPLTAVLGNWVGFNFAFPNAPAAAWTTMVLTSPYVGVAGQVPKYWKDPYGVVWMTGQMTGGTTSDTTFWMPPAGYAMDGGDTGTGEYHQPALSGSNFGYVNFSIGNGAKARTNVANFAIDNLRYPAAGNTLKWNLFSTLYNSWANYGSGYPSAAFALRPDGLIQYRGLVRNGTLGLTGAKQLPTYQPSHRLIIAAVSNGAAARLDIASDDSDGAVIPDAGSATWFSLDGFIITPEPWRRNPSY